MHELGIMQNILSVVQDYARRNNAKKVLKVVLEVGSLSGVVPEALEFCFDACIKGTALEGAGLEIQKVAAIALCGGCGKEFDIIENSFSCPFCNGSAGDGEAWEAISGKELIIKELGII